MTWPWAWEIRKPCAPTKRITSLVRPPTAISCAMANGPPAKIFFPSARMLTQPPCHVSTYPLMCFLTDFAHLSRAWPSILPFCRVRGGNGVHQHQASSERRCGLQRSSNGISSPSCASGVIFRPSASRRHPLHAPEPFRHGLKFSNRCHSECLDSPSVFA